MSDALKLDVKEVESQEWLVKEPEVNSSLKVPVNPSAYPFGETELCQSKVNFICGMLSKPVSG